MAEVIKEEERRAKSGQKGRYPRAREEERYGVSFSKENIIFFICKMM